MIPERDMRDAVRKATRPPLPKTKPPTPAASKGQRAWRSIDDALAEVRECLNGVGRDLHPEDRVKFAEKLAEICRAAAKKQGDQNEQHGVPERGPGSP